MTSKAFKGFIETLPGDGLWEDMWMVYCAGYEDAIKRYRCPKCNEPSLPSITCSSCGYDSEDEHSVVIAEKIIH